MNKCVSYFYKNTQYFNIQSVVDFLEKMQKSDLFTKFDLVAQCYSRNDEDYDCDDSCPERLKMIRISSPKKLPFFIKLELDWKLYPYYWKSK